MAFKQLAFISALLLLIPISWASFSLSNNTIECCSPWQSTLTMTKADGTPYPNCRVLMSVMETRGVIETTISSYSYFTDSFGKAILAYTPQKPGEKLKISFSCGDNKGDATLLVTGVGKAPTVPKMDFQLPPIETGQIAAVAFILFTVVFIWKGKPLLDSFKKMSVGSKKEPNKQEIEEMEMSPRRLITEHERKVAAKMAKKHRRKEVRLDHEFMRKL